MFRSVDTALTDLAPIWWALAGVGLLLVLKVKGMVSERQRNPRRLPLPPGPKGLPVLGNFFQMPQEEPWIAYHALCQKYGDIVYLNAFGLPVLVLGSSRRAMDLLDKRSANFSDRLPLPVLELIKRSTWDFSSMPYGPRWRLLRRTFHKYLSPTATARYHPIMQEEIQRCLLDLRSRPDDFLSRVELLFGTIIMRASYGFEDIETNKTLIKNGQRVAQQVGEVMNPTKFLINVFPSLQYVPEWFPGAGWKAHLRWLSDLSEQTRRQPFDDAKANRQSTKCTCIASSLIDDLLDETKPANSQVEAESLCRDVAAVAYSGGSDTTISSVVALIFALATHPEVQQKATAELDAVVGFDRLPTMADRPTLPYLQAIIKEISRWFTVVPMGASHASSEDSEYDGYFIPKGTVVMPNAWAIMHDPETFENPHEFNPGRYIRDGQIDPSVFDAEQAAFGYGRRICPGRHFSADSLFLFAASLLATFTIELPKDEAGNSVPLEFKATSHAVSKPLPFECKLVPRPCHEHLLQPPRR